MACRFRCGESTPAVCRIPALCALAFFAHAALGFGPEMTEAASGRERRARFGYWLEVRRGRRTAAEVAACAGRSRFWYLRIEEGLRRSMGLKDLRLLAAALGVPEAEVRGEAERAGY